MACVCVSSVALFPAHLFSPGLLYRCLRLGYFSLEQLYSISESAGRSGGRRPDITHLQRRRVPAVYTETARVQILVGVCARDSYLYRHDLLFRL